MTTITLKKPVTHDGRTYTAVEIDEPSGGGIEAFENAKLAGESETGCTLKMLAVDLDWPLAAVRKIKASDLVRISDALAPFVDAVGSTGG